MVEEVKEKKLFCETTCPLCKRARNKGGTAKWVVKNLTSKVCPFCRQYQRVRQVPPYEKVAVEEELVEEVAIEEEQVEEVVKDVEEVPAASIEEGETTPSDQDTT